MAVTRPVGSALRWDPEQIAAESIIRTNDAAAAVAAWQEAMRGQYKSLILSDLKGSAVTFDQSRLRYMIAGRAVAEETIKKAGITASVQWGKRMQAVTAQLIDGSISIADWQRQMSAMVKDSHTAMTILGKGGVANVTREDALYLEGELRFQNERLARFALQIERGEVGATAAIQERVALYGAASNPTYEQARRAAALSNGIEEERRVLGASEHCDGCAEQAALGWQPVGTLDDIGDEECKWNCRCHFEYRSPEQDKAGKGKGGPAGAMPEGPSAMETAAEFAPLLLKLQDLLKPEDRRRQR